MGVPCEYPGKSALNSLERSSYRKARFLQPPGGGAWKAGDDMLVGKGEGAPSFSRIVSLGGELYDFELSPESRR